MKLISRTLGDICDEVRGTIRTGPFGSQLHEADYLEQGTPVVMPKNIVNGKISVDDIARIGDNDAHRLSQHKLYVGDIVYGRRGDIGRRGFITKKEEGWICGTGCLRISIGYRVLDPIFLYYYLGNPKVVAWVTSQAIGATLPNLNTSIIRRIPVKYPHLSVQHKIAAILSAYDDLIENNTRRIAILEEMAQAIYQEWFVRFRYPGHEENEIVESDLGMIPEGWHIRKLGEIAGVNLTSIKKGQEPDIINYIDINSVSTGHINNIEAMHFSEAPGRARRLVKHGDIIWSTVRPNRRSYSIIINPVDNLVVSTGFAVISAKNVPYTYLYASLTTSNFVDYLVNHASGSAYPAVNSTDFLEAQVLLPPRDLLNLFHNIVSDILLQKYNLHQKNSILSKTRQLLLPKLISGEIDVEPLDIDIPDIIEPEERQETSIMASPEAMDATQLALPLLQY